MRVVEVAVGSTLVANGHAANLPGAILRSLGFEVAHVRTGSSPTPWDEGKDIVEVADADAARSAARSLAADADAVIVFGPDPLVEERPDLVRVHIRHDVELLVAARMGLPTQIRGHRPGPIFPDLPVASAGAGLVATVGALAGLFDREASGLGGWFETTLLDGAYALLPMIMGRVEHHSPSTRLLWERQGPAESLAYRCADGEYVQLWFGAKGAYDAFLEHMGEPPSEGGYQADLMSGAMAEREVRWREAFAAHDRAWWLEHLAGHDFRAEPVLRPGELDPLPLVTVTPTAAAGCETSRAAVPPASRLLEGVRVLDLSAYLAGPVAARVLAELGADVLKVEPPSGDVHRSMEPMFAAGQRHKRAVSVDLKAPDAPEVLARLFEWAEVVHHNSRVGLAERLGYDEASVRAANPDAVYCHASGFGQTGPKAELPANDQLMQALSGIEASQAGIGNPPTFLVWGAVDVASGWLSACGILAGLLDRRRTGRGQSVDTTLLGAALMLKPGGGPILDTAQLGYGPGYRLYRCAGGEWLALAGTDPSSDPAVDFGSRQRDEWLASALPVEAVDDLDRAAFIARALDDRENRELGRVVTFEWGERGRVEVLGNPLRMGPRPAPPVRPGIPGLGEHTDEVLA